MQAIEMVSRPSLPMERTKVPTNQRVQMHEPDSPPNEGRRETVLRQPAILDAFDKIILDYDDRNLCPMQAMALHGGAF